MRFLADEGCDFAVVRTLRTAGHDVVAILEIAPRAEDTEIIDLAIREQRVLLTEDKDLGSLYMPIHEQRAASFSSAFLAMHGRHCLRQC